MASLRRSRLSSSLSSTAAAALVLGLLGFGAAAFAGCSDAGSPEKIGQSSAADTTFPNDRASFDFFVSKGLSGAQAAGIVGNLDVESGDDPTISQEGGGPGRGLAQWLVGGRWDTTSGDNATDYAASQGESVLSLNAQLGFIWYELNKFPSYGLARLQEATTVSAAVSAFEADFEGCSTCDSSARVTDGENVLATYGSEPIETLDAGSGSGDDDDASTGCIVPATGESGECLATSACEALGNHTSTAGYCPGADDIQCCTANPGTTTTTGADGGAVTTGGSGGGSGSGATTGGSTTSKDGGAASADADSSDSSGGCSTSGHAPVQKQDAIWMVGLALLGLERRRRRT